MCPLNSVRGYLSLSKALFSALSSTTCLAVWLKLQSRAWTRLQWRRDPFTMQPHNRLVCGTRGDLKRTHTFFVRILTSYTPSSPSSSLCFHQVKRIERQTRNRGYISHGCYIKYTSLMTYAPSIHRWSARSGNEPCCPKRPAWPDSAQTACGSERKNHRKKKASRRNRKISVKTQKFTMKNAICIVCEWPTTIIRLQQFPFHSCSCLLPTLLSIFTVHGL